MRPTSAAVLAFLSGLAAVAHAAGTPIGAQLEGNADGTIPAWNGGLLPTAWPDAFTPGSLADPYPQDRPLFTISAANLGEHAHRLAAGHRVLLERDADYRLPVYATHRSVSFPEAVEAATAANRGRARLRGVDAIEGADLGAPFVAPRSGAEVLWNHRLRYRGDSSEWRYARAAVFGATRQVGQALERNLFGYANLASRARRDMQSWTFLHIRPAQDYPDYTSVWHDAVNLLDHPRRLWGGVSSWKPVRHPPLGHDDVGLFSYRIRYFDMVDMFSGSFDRYTFRLIGKQELYVPYNAFRLAGRGVDALGPTHLAPEHARYELHRVWVVEASLRPDSGHSIRKRVFYVDEDSWSILLVDGYDDAGRLVRFQEGHLLPVYEFQAVEYAPVVTYDLAEGRYFADRLLVRPPRFNTPLRPGDFQPGALRKPLSLT